VRRPSAPVAAVVAALAMATALLGGPGFPSVPTAVLFLVAYGGLGVVLVDGRHLDRRLVIGLGFGLVVLAVARPPMQSHDLWSYVMYGRELSHHHVSPYTHAPDLFAHDPFLHRVDPLWRHAESVYGPLFTAWSGIITLVGGSVTLLLRLGFQLTAAVAVLAAAHLVDRRTNGDPRALAVVLLNPLVVFSLVNDAHVDALVGLAVLGSVLLLERRRPALAGGVLGLAVLVKVIALLPAGAIGLWMLSRRRRWSAIAPFALALGVVVLLGYGAGGGRSAVQPVLDSSSRVSGASIWGPPNRSAIDTEEHQGDAPAVAKKEAGRSLSRYGTLSVVVLTTALALLFAGEAVPILAAGGAILAYTLVGAYVYPWYAAGALFVLALRRRSPLLGVLLALSAVLQIAEVPGRQFLAFANRQQRFPDPGWHKWFRAHGAPALDLLLLGALLVLLGRTFLRDRAARSSPHDVVGEEREQVD